MDLEETEARNDCAGKASSNLTDQPTAKSPSWGVSEWVNKWDWAPVGSLPSRGEVTSSSQTPLLFEKEAPLQNM
jgi:hypothetical protein